MRQVHQRRVCNSAVSPVIAVILLLAITVVLASVMYITILNVMPTVHQNPTPVGATVSKSGTNWVVEIVAVTGSVSTSFVYLQVVDNNGNSLLNSTPLSNLTGFLDLNPIGIVNPGDRALLPVATYPQGSWIVLMDDQKVLYHHELTS